MREALAEAEAAGEAGLPSDRRGARPRRRGRLPRTEPLRRGAGIGLQLIETVLYVQRHIRTFEGGVLEEESLDLIARHDPELRAFLQG